MADILDFNAARARRRTEDEAFEGLDALIEADLAAEEKLPRERLSPEALAALRVDLIGVMSGAGARTTDRASVLHTVLYAMVRELLDHRANALQLQALYRDHVVNKRDSFWFEDSVACIAVRAEKDADHEILCGLAVELGVPGG